MSERGQTDGGEGGRRPLGGDLIIPVGTAAFAIYYLYTVWGLSWQAGSAGIGISAGIAVLLVILAIRFIGELRRGEADLGLGEILHPVPYLVRRIGILAAAVGNALQRVESTPCTLSKKMDRTAVGLSRA